MARQKQEGRDILQADMRLAGQTSIDKTLDLGNGLTNAAYKALIDETRASLMAYNESLSTTDQLLNAHKAKLKDLKTYSERSLKSVGVKFGFDSDEYEMAGGTRKSEYKSGRKTVPKP